MLNGTKRILKYALTGGSTFLFDLFLLYMFISKLQWQPVYAAGVAFFIAVSINYTLSRKYVFKGTKRSFKQAYLGFLSIALVGLLIVMGGMYLFVENFNLNYMLSRVIVAMMTGLWNYFLNLYVNFKVAGKEH